MYILNAAAGLQSTPGMGAHDYCCSADSRQRIWTAQAKPLTSASHRPMQHSWHLCAPGSGDDELLYAAGIEVKGVGAQLVLEVPQLQFARVDRHQNGKQVLFRVNCPLVSLKQGLLLLGEGWQVACSSGGEASGRSRQLAAHCASMRQPWKLGVVHQGAAGSQQHWFGYNAGHRGVAGHDMSAGQHLWT